MLKVSARKRVGDFTLDASWSSDHPIVALVGPSGSGKTLTLQCIAGLIAPDAGHIVSAGRVLFDAEAQINLRPQRRCVGYVFQGYALFPHMTVLQNVAFARPRTPRFGATTSATPPDRTVEIIERLGLTSLSARYPTDLSGGQQQRVALARALATDPDVLLLDEPLSALDAPLRRELCGELSQTLHDWGKIAVLVTHDLSEAYQIADTVVLYEHGQTTGAVAKNDLLWNPSSERVAKLIGARNILRAPIAEPPMDSIVLNWRGGRLEAARSPSHQLHATVGEMLAFFVRPEYVRLIRKNRPVTDGLRQTNLFRGEIVGERDEGTTWALFFRLDAPGTPSQGHYDLEIEIPKLVYERLNIPHDRHWEVSIHPGSIQVLPG
ncbi:MAG TPA: ATP-binding cassette domain-containing protein [Vicinamibacterales bacterium]|nr:ATP-binding cassette domain-containing protein [Vicinamibacterales bacterium]